MIIIQKNIGRDFRTCTSVPIPDRGSQGQIPLGSATLLTATNRQMSHIRRYATLVTPRIVMWERVDYTSHIPDGHSLIGHAFPKVVILVNQRRCFQSPCDLNAPVLSLDGNKIMRQDIYKSCYSSVQRKIYGRVLLYRYFGSFIYSTYIGVYIGVQRIFNTSIQSKKNGLSPS